MASTKHFVLHGEYLVTRRMDRRISGSIILPEVLTAIVPDILLSPSLCANFLKGTNQIMHFATSEYLSASKNSRLWLLGRPNNRVTKDRFSTISTIVTSFPRTVSGSSCTRQSSSRVRQKCVFQPGKQRIPSLPSPTR